MTFTVAIVGRPNVGKSTLFNRLTGSRRAIVDDTPGVTRDRREAAANIGPLEFTIFDTAGLEEAAKDSLHGRMTEQTKQAIRDADVALMLVDGRDGLTPMDKHFAKLIRSMKKPVVLAVNKVEGKKGQDAVAEAYQLGLGDPIPISAEHGEGMADLYEALEPFCGDPAFVAGESTESQEDPVQAQRASQDYIRLAIVGRPNVGKSTLMNAILGEERMLTGPEAGITRDSVQVVHEFGDKKLLLSDTAGIRKKSSVKGNIEQQAVADAIASIRHAEVAILVLDAEMPLEKQDNMIAALVEQEGRALVIAINKWDLVEDEEKFMKAFRQRLDYVLPQVSGVTVVPISAAKKTNIKKLLKACITAHAVWNSHFPTGELNRWLEKALEKHTPPLINGRRLKIRYLTQKTARPPTFILFSNLSEIPDHYSRYLINQMREWFDLQGTPIRFKLRTSKNPYSDKD
jgi:GTP-binding protein